MDTARLNRILFGMLVLTCLVSLLTVSVLGYLLWDRRIDVTAAGKLNVQSITDKASGEIAERLREMPLVVQSLARDLSSGAVREDSLPERLENDYQAQSEVIFEIGVAYDPTAPCTGSAERAPHFGRKDHQIQHFSLEDHYPISYTQYDWFQDASQNGSGWVEPYLGGATKEPVVGFVSAFHCPNPIAGERRVAGVVRANLSLEQIRRLLHRLDLGATGYGYILSAQGAYIAHPDPERVRSLATAFSDPAVTDSEDLRQLVESAIAGERGLIDHLHPQMNRASWIAYAPIESTGWSLIVVSFKDETIRETADVRHTLIWIGLGVIAFLLSASLLLTGAHSGSTQGLWMGGVFISSLLFTLGIVGVWYLARTMPDENRELLGVTVTSDSGAHEFLATNTHWAREWIAGYEAPIYVPTGVFVQSVEFTSANNVVLTGYLWQKYGPQVPPDIAKGFIFPEAKSVDIVPAYEVDNEKRKLIGWQFSATFRETFDYSAYPFDQQDVWIRIWHQNFHRNVILVPDFDAYDYVNPSQKPGIEDVQKFVIPGWEIDSTFFSYRENSYGSNFGIDDYVGQRRFPELYFNIALDRKFLDPFVSNIIPLIAIVSMLFAVLLFGTKRGDKAELIGFSASVVLSICAAFFFTVVIAHVTLRSNLDAETVVYIEYFYFVLYLALLGVSLNAMLFTRDDRIPVVHHLVHSRDNLVPKLLYWPVLTGLLLLITIVVFY